MKLFIKIIAGIIAIPLFAMLVHFLFNYVSPWLAWLSVILAVAGIIWLITKSSKNLNLLVIFGLISALSSCTKVAPNYYGVLMENYGKNGKSDYSKQQGSVNTSSPGTELFQVPAWVQRADFEKQVLHLKAADNTDFTARPLYSYKAIDSKVVDLVFQNSRLGSGEDFMKQLENNILESNIYDIIKEESRMYSTDTLMASGGNLNFEKKVQEKVRKAFEDAGLELKSFSANLDFSSKVKAKIDSRNEVNTNISVIDQQITEQKKKNELAELQAQEDIIRSKGITPQILEQQAIQKWNGVLPSTVAGGNMPFVKSIK